MASETWHCGVCLGDLHVSQTAAGTGALKGERVHLADTGPGHADVAMHPVVEGAMFGCPVPRLRPSAPWAPPDQQMMAGPAGVVLWTDYSEWQAPPYNGTYPHRFAAYRVSLGGTYTDLKVGPNSSWCVRNAGPGKQLSLGHMGYHVWYPGNEAGQAGRFFTILGGAADANFAAMVDVESWSGQIAGDHSGQVTAMCDALAARLGSAARVKLYGNSGDLASIAPDVPAKYGRIKAGYSSQPPAEPWDGWQFSDGQPTYPVPDAWPRSSPPAGGSDHNAFYGTDDQFRRVYGLPTIGDPPVTPAEIQQIADAVWGRIMTRTDDAGKPNSGQHTAGSWLMAVAQAAQMNLPAAADHRAGLLLYGDSQAAATGTVDPKTGKATPQTHPFNLYQLTAAVTRLAAAVAAFSAALTPAAIAAALKADPPPGVDLTDAQLAALADRIGALIPAVEPADYSATFTASPVSRPTEAK